MERWADCEEGDPAAPPPDPRTTSNNRYMAWLKENPCTQKYFKCLERDREWTRLERAQKQALRQAAIPWETVKLKQWWRRPRHGPTWPHSSRGSPQLVEKASYDSLIRHASLFAPKSEY